MSFLYQGKPSPPKYFFNHSYWVDTSFQSSFYGPLKLLPQYEACSPWVHRTAQDETEPCLVRSSFFKP